MVVSVLHQHPTINFSKFQEQLLQTLNILDQSKQDFLLCGDFNIDLLKQEFKMIKMQFIQKIVVISLTN